MNAVKTFFLMMVMSALLLIVGALLGGVGGIIFALVLAIVMNFSAYWFSDRIALKMTHAVEVTENDDPELYSIVREQATRAGLPMPKVFEIESEALGRGNDFLGTLVYPECCHGHLRVDHLFSQNAYLDSHSSPIGKRPF